MSNLIKQIRNIGLLGPAVMMMTENMQDMDPTWQCDGEIVASRRGAYVNVSYEIDGKRVTDTVTIFKADSNEYVAIPHMYSDEGAEFQGDMGNCYTLVDSDTVVRCNQCLDS